MSYINHTYLNIYRNSMKYSDAYVHYLFNEVQCIINHGYNCAKLSEAQESLLKDKMEQVQDLIISMRSILDHFLKKSLHLKDKMNSIIEKINNIKKIENKNIEFSYDIFPYWRKYKLLYENDFPKFDINDKELIESLSSEETFYVKYLVNYLKEDNFVIDNYVEYIRGSEKKIKFNISELYIQLNDILGYYTNYKNLIDSLVSQYNFTEYMFSSFKRQLIANFDLTENGLFLFNENKLFNDLDYVDYQTLNESSQILFEENEEIDEEKNNTSSNKDYKDLVEKFNRYIKEYYKILSIKMKLSEEIFYSYEDLIEKINRKV